MFGQCSNLYPLFYSRHIKWYHWSEIGWWWLGHVMVYWVIYFVFHCENKHFKPSVHSLWTLPVRLTSKTELESFPFQLRFPAKIYLFRVNNRNIKRCKICSKLTIQTAERRHWRRFGDFIVNFEHFSHVFLLFLLLTLNK